MPDRSAEAIGDSQRNDRLRDHDERSADMKKLADAAQPLYASLEPEQKRQFADELIRLSRE
jgi:hypothetical protein